MELEPVLVLGGLQAWVQWKVCPEPCALAVFLPAFGRRAGGVHGKGEESCSTCFGTNPRLGFRVVYVPALLE